MSKYKVGDKVVLTVTDKNEEGQYPDYVLNDNFYFGKQSLEKHTEPLSTFYIYFFRFWKSPDTIGHFCML